MRHVVGVADAKISSEPGDSIVTHALGSCLGIAAHDPVARVGGILHVMLPTSSVNPDKAARNPYMFVDAGLPRFFKELYAAGAEKEQLRVKVAGGGKMGVEETDVFAIGRRNYDMLHKLLLEDGIRITGEDIGGKISRTLYLDIGTGRTWLMSNGKVWDL